MENQIDKEFIIQEALKLLNKSGIQSLSMRKLAEQIGIKAASIYWHVKNKSELLQLLADKISEMVVYEEKSVSWEQGLKVLASRYRAVLMSYRDSADIMMITLPFTPNRLKLIDNVFNQFIKAGLNKEDIPSAASLFHNYILSFVMDETNLSGQDHDPSLEFHSKDAEKYPSLAIIQSSANKHQEMNERFQFGLEVLIMGFKSRI